MECAVTDCEHPAVKGKRYCSPHQHRYTTYGTPDPIDPPIPYYAAPGVTDERVAELKALSWTELVALVDSILADHHPDEDL